MTTQPWMVWLNLIGSLDKTWSTRMFLASNKNVFADFCTNDDCVHNLTVSTDKTLALQSEGSPLREISGGWEQWISSAYIHVSRERPWGVVHYLETKLVLWYCVHWTLYSWLGWCGQLLPWSRESPWPSSKIHTTRAGQDNRTIICWTNAHLSRMLELFSTRVRDMNTRTRVVCIVSTCVVSSMTIYKIFLNHTLRKKRILMSKQLVNCRVRQMLLEMKRLVASQRLLNMSLILCWWL